MQRKEIEEEEEEEEEDEGGFVSSHSSFGGMRPKVKTNSPTKHGQACGSPTLFMCECFFYKKWPIPASFCSFWSISHYNFNNPN